MKRTNQVAELIFKQTISNTSSIVITPPSNTRSILIIANSVFPANVSGLPFLIAQTSDGSSFDTTGYASGEYFIQSSSNAWSNTALTTGLQLSCQYASLLQYTSVSFVITDLNISNKASSYGQGMSFNGGNGITFMLKFVGRSPTSSTTQIKLLMSDSTLISSGLITAYSLI